jgi:polyhydroxyalkanoate synthesis regulator phasin
MAIRIPIITDFQGDGIKKTYAEFKNLSTNAERASFVMKRAMIPATAAITALGVELVQAAKAAAADQAAQAQLARQLVASTNATTAQVKENESFISSLQMTAAVADDELRPALASLVRGTGDLASAQTALQTALDVSAATGKSVQEVSDALSKAYGGNTKAIKQLSPELFGLIKDGASVNEVMQSLNGTFGGASEAAAESAQGSFKKISIALGEIQETIGNQVLPYMTRLTDSLTNIATWVNKNPQTWGKLAEGIKFVGIEFFKATNSAFGFFGTLINGISSLVTTEKQFGAYNEKLGVSNAQQMRISDSAGIANKGLLNLGEGAGGAGKAVDEMAKKIKDAREALEKEFSDALDAATEKLDVARQAYDDFKTTIAESVTGEFSIAGAADAAKEAGTTILDQLTQQAQGAKQFGKQVEQLLRMGISEQALRKVLEAGQQAGSAIATELIQGGSDAILGPNGINQLVSDLNLVAEAVGILGADEFYKAGVTQGQAMVKGISDVISQMEQKLKNPNLKLADIKGIGASFSSSVASINAPTVSASALSVEERAGIAAGRGDNIYNISVNGGLATSAEIGRLVIDNIKAANRAYGPAAIEVL